MNLIDSHASLQSSHSCKLNAAWVVGLTYLHVVVKCQSLSGGHGEERCTVKTKYIAFLDGFPVAMVIYLVFVNEYILLAIIAVSYSTKTLPLRA